MRHEAGEIDRSHILCSFENSTIEFKINIMGTKQLLSIITTISWGMREKTRSQDSGLPGGAHLSGALVYLLFGSAQKIKGSSALPSLSTIIF